jgi:hypothetical protein
MACRSGRTSSMPHQKRHRHERSAGSRCIRQDADRRVPIRSTSPRTVNQSWLKQLTASFNDLVGAGKEGAADRGRNAAAYAVSEIPRLRPAPIMPASAIIISTPTNPPSAKAIAPPATPPLPPRKVPALTTPEP